MQTAAGVGAKSARKAKTSAGAEAKRRSDLVAKSGVLEVMKDMDVIEVIKVLSEYMFYCVL